LPGTFAALAPNDRCNTYAGFATKFETALLS